MKILSKFACWFNAKWGWFFTNGNKINRSQAIRQGEVHYEIGNGWAGWYVVEILKPTYKDYTGVSELHYMHPLHPQQEGMYLQNTKVYFVLECDNTLELQHPCDFAWVVGKVADYYAGAC